MDCKIIGTKREENHTQGPGWWLFCLRKDPEVTGLRSIKLYLTDHVIERDLKGAIPKPNSLMAYVCWYRNYIRNVDDIIELEEE